VEKWKAYAAEHFGDRAEEFLKLYPGETDEQAVASAIAYGSDSWIAFGTWKWIEAQRKTGDSPVIPLSPGTGRADQQVSSGVVCVPFRRY